MVPAKMQDNPSLTENDPDYVKKLEGLGDPALIEMKSGDWDMTAGFVFGRVAACTSMWSSP